MVALCIDIDTRVHKYVQTKKAGDGSVETSINKNKSDFELLLSFRKL